MSMAVSSHNTEGSVMTARGWGSKADLEYEIEELEGRISELVAALDEIADLLQDVTATMFTDLHRDQILEWAGVR